MHNIDCVITPLPTNSTNLLNNFFKKGLLLIVSFFILIIFQSSQGFAQRVHSNEESHSSVHLPLQYSQDEQLKRSFKNIKYSYYNNPNRNASVNCPPNIDFEEGTFNHWTCDTGFVRGVDGFDPVLNQNFFSVFGPSTTGVNQVVMTVTPPMPNRHELIQNTGAPIALDPYGGFPIYPPDGSGFAVKLGSDLDHPGEGRPDARAERISYSINVPANVIDYAFTYQYAVVFQDPGHVPENQPRFTVKLFDPLTNDYVPCGSVKYVADSTIPGFQLSHVQGARDVWYKPWSPVFINLARYRGRTLYLEFTTEDCAQGGHWGYAYIDVNGCEVTATAKNNCQQPPRTVLSAPSGFIGYNWWSSDYSSLLATGQHAAVSPSLPLNSTVHLELIPNSGANCRDTLTIFVTKDTLIYNHDGDKNICSDSTVTIGTGLTLPNCIYTWSPNSFINTINQPTANVHPPQTADYYLQVMDTVSYCKAFDTINVHVNPIPVITATNASACEGSNIVLSASGANQFSWSPATGLNSTTGNQVTANAVSTITYTITGYLDGSTCTSDKNIRLTVYPKPQPNFNQPAPQCLNNNQFNFTSTSTISNGNITGSNWYLLGSSMLTGTTVSQQFTTAGNYNIKLVTVSNNGCKDSLTRTIVVYPDPSVNITVNGPSAFCAGSNVQLNATVQNGNAAIVSYQWSDQNGNISGANGSSLLVNHTGNYQLAITNANGCTANSTIAAITENPLPQGVINIPSVDYICEGSNVMLSSPSIASSYQWYYNGNLILGAVQSQYAATQQGNYTLEITSAAGCKALANGNITLSIYKKPVLDFDFPVRCELLPVQFTNNSDTSLSGNVTWLWSFGDGYQSGLYAPSHIYQSGSNYTVTLSATPLRCPSLVTSYNQLVHVDQSVAGLRYPVVDAVSNTRTPLHARNIASRYFWRPAIGLSDANIKDPYFNFNHSMEYQIRLITASGCNIVDTQLVRIQPAVDIQVPTAFTPNGDNHNDWLDVFLIGIKELKFFRVFNRWGQLLFETHNPRQLWDGNFHGKKQPAETYVWTAEGLGINGQTIIRRGQTILIR
jgi:gliding motility-associated-like protein